MRKIIKKTGILSLLLIYFIGIFATTAPIANAEYCGKGDTGISDIAFSDSVTIGDVEVSSRIFELIFGEKKSESKRLMLYPGGSAFGLMIKEDGVTVTASSNNALKVGDRIISANGKEITECRDVEILLKECAGKRIDFAVIRDGEKINLSVTPKREGEAYKLGVTLRDKTAGIGTVTFIDPETKAFGGLGHGVSDGASYVSIKSATANAVTLGGCKRGEAGKAGEITGVLKKDALGNIVKNCDCGVFGVLNEIPDYCTEPMPIATKDEVKCGKAQIISTVKNGLRATYDIEIKDIDKDSDGPKSFKIEVTDKSLIALTGGIVRGMSGSPIIQDGKLVGAVTHVMVADPTEGYGIFIENMLNASEGARSELPKSA